MNKFKKIIYFIIAAIIVVFFLIMLYNIKLNMSHYKINYFNDTIKVNSMSICNNDVYYYVNNNKDIYELSSNNEKKCIVKETEISGISFLNDFIYYISHEKLFRYNINDKIIELLDEENGYRYISSDKKYVYALCFKNGNFTDYKLLKVNDNYKSEFIPNDSDWNGEISIYIQDDNSKYLCNNTPYKSFCGIVNEDGSIVFRITDMVNKNLIYFNDITIITSDDKCEQLLVYGDNGKFKEIINILEGYSYISQNVYSNNNDIYMLLQSQNGYKAIGYYNLSQRRHRYDAIAKYDVKNKNFSLIYETKNKYERIVGYKDDIIICLYNGYLYSVNINEHQKKKIAKINVSNVTFEICGDKIFAWNNGEFIDAYNIKS